MKKVQTIKSVDGNFRLDGGFCEAYEEAEIQRYYAEHSSSILGTVWKWNLTYYGSSETYECRFISK